MGMNLKSIIEPRIRLSCSQYHVGRFHGIDMVVLEYFSDLVPAPEGLCL